MEMDPEKAALSLQNVNQLPSYVTLICTFQLNMLTLMLVYLLQGTRTVCTVLFQTSKGNFM